MGGDYSSSDDSDDSETFSLHDSSGPVMGGKGPGQLDWMNKFTKTKQTTPTPTPANGLPSNGRKPPERRGVAPSSSFSRGEIEKPHQPEWMKKFQTMSQNKSSGVTDSRERSPSPTREPIQNQAPTTPGWMKQFRKGPVVAGAPVIPSIPSIAPAPLVDTLPEPTPTQPAASQKNQVKPSKKDWKALLKTSKSAPETAPTPAPAPIPAPVPAPVAPRYVAPETPQWMNRFTTGGKGLPMAPNMDADDSDDDKSVTSVGTAASVEPEWMSQFSTVKAGNIEPKRIKPPPRTNKASEPEWIQKFKRRESAAGEENSGKAPLETIDPVTSPTRRGSGSFGSGEEPEWMTRYREIGVHDVQASPSRSKPVFRPIERMAAPSADLRSSPVKATRTHRSNNASFSGIDVFLKSVKPAMGGSKWQNNSFSGAGTMSAPASPVSTGKIVVGGVMKMSPSLMGGMLSAPSSPATNGKIRIGAGGMSAPSSPMGGPGTLLNQATFTMTLGPPAVLQQRQDDVPVKKAPDPKPVDPAVEAPQKLSWMNKVKAVAQSTKKQPDWMIKLKRRNQGIEEPGPRKGTPPWKRKERLREEQARKLREETGMLPKFDDSIDIAKATEGGDQSSGSDEDSAKDEDEQEEEENVPEWMRQFRKMHLKEAEVLTAQGRAPQGVSRLRRGSMQMIERSNMYNPTDDHVKSMPAIVPKSATKQPRRNRRDPRPSEPVSAVNNESPVYAETTRISSDVDQAPTKTSEVPKGVKSEPATPVPKVDVQKPQQIIPPVLGTKDQKRASEEPPADASIGSSIAKPDEEACSYSAQVEIDNSKPENVMSMWGSTIKAKKPGSSTIMSFRMIQNQADMVKERIARAKQKADAEENNSDEDSIKDVDQINHTAAVGLDNSAAALFGLSGGKAGTPKRESVSMDNSEAALFGFSGGAAGGAKHTASGSMDNSAAALFGFNKGHESSSSIDIGKDAQSSKASSMENSAAAIFGFGGTPGAADDKTNINTVSMDNSGAALFGVGGKESKSAVEQHESKATWTKRQSIAEEASDKDEDSSDEDKNAKSRVPIASADKSDDSSSDDEKESVDKFNSAKPLGPPKKSFLDDSSSGDDSDTSPKKSVKPPLRMNSAPPSSQPVTGAKNSVFATKKKSFLDDSDSDDSSDDEKPNVATKKILSGSESESSGKKTENTPSRMDPPKFAKKSTFDSDSDDDSDDEKPNTGAASQAPNKSSFSGDSDSDGDHKKETTPKSEEKPITSSSAKKSFLADSDREDDSDGGKEKKLTEAGPKKTFLDDSDSDSDGDDEKAKKPAKPPAPSPSTSKKLSMGGSDSDDSSVDEKSKPTAPAVSTTKTSLADSDDDSSDDEDNRKKVGSSAVPPKKKSFLDDSDSDDSSVDEKPKFTPMKLSRPAYDETNSPVKEKSSHDAPSSNSDDSSAARRKKKEASKGDAVASAYAWDKPTPIVSPHAEEEKKSQEKEQSMPVIDDWAMGFDDNKNDDQNADSEWQKALEELAAEEEAKREKGEQNAWQAALEGLAADEAKQKDDNSLWDNALKDLEAEAQEMKESKVGDKKKHKEADKSAISADKGTIKKIAKDKRADSPSRKKPKEDGKKKDSDKKRDSKSKERNDRSPSKSPKAKSKKNGLTVKGAAKKESSDPSPFDSSPFGASPFGSSPFDSSPSPFAPLGGAETKQSDAPPFAPLSRAEKKMKKKKDASPFAPVDSGMSPFGPPDATMSSSSPFALLGGMDSDPFAPLTENDKKKKGKSVLSPSKPKKPKSTMRLVIPSAKLKGTLHKKRASSDDDSLGRKDDFDDNYSTAGGFGDWNDDGSVMVRSVAGSKMKSITIGTKPPLRGLKTVKPNVLAKKDSKDSKSKDKHSSGSRSKSSDRKGSRSRSSTLAKGRSRSRSKSAEGRKSQDRSKSVEKKSSRSKSDEKERGRSSSVGRRKATKKKGKE